MPQATLGSIAIDARDGVMLVLARWRYSGLKNHPDLPPSGLYEHLVGICTEPGAGGESSAAAVKQILQKACTVSQGRRGKDLVHGENDVLDEALLARVRDRAVCALLKGLGLQGLGLWGGLGLRTVVITLDTHSKTLFAHR